MLDQEQGGRSSQTTGQRFPGEQGMQRGGVWGGELAIISINI